MFHRNSLHPQGTLHQNLKLAEIYQIEKAIHIILQIPAANVDNVGFTNYD